MDDLIKANKVRKILRSLFTRNFNIIEKLLEENNFSEAKATCDVLDGVWLKLHDRDEEIFRLMLEDEQVTDEDHEKEGISACEYETKYRFLKRKIEELNFESNKTSNDELGSLVSGDNSKKLKLPPIKLDIFDGDIKNWLPFWGQFEQIHLDDSIATFHKYRILLQSLKEGSRARQVVDSFPISKDLDNYNAAVEALKERFGREDMLIEVYIRELLEIIVLNSKSTKFSLVDMYDKLECHLRFLEILGVTTGKCAAILCPLLESCMPEDFLRVWQRSYVSDEVKDADQRLNKFRTFIKAEVQNEQRISLAMSKFGIGVSSNNKTEKRVQHQHTVRPKDMSEIPTATGLLTTQGIRPKRTNCIFCDQPHNSVDCFKARDMSLDHKLQRVRERKSCYLCLKCNHSSKQCKTRSSCPVCDRKHALLLCPNYSRSKNNSLSGNAQTVSGTSGKNEDKPAVSVNTTTSLTCDSSVLLPTVRIRLNGPRGGTNIVRAVFDTAAQRSYVLNSTAEKLGCKLIGEETLYHSLFGGNKLDKTVSKKFDINLSSLNGEYSCSIVALGQDIICTDLPTVTKGPWINEMVNCGIDVSQVLSDTGPIELLLGADVAGLLFTGNIKRFHNNSLVGIETLFGWTISGRIPVQHGKVTSATLVTTMLVNTMNVTDLWRLDLIGIDDPTNRGTESSVHANVKQYFLDTVVINDDGRYEVNLPWKKDHVPLPTNFNIANKRLNIELKKLENEGHLAGYQQMLDEWIAEGVIEEVTLSTVDDGGHYLPHRHIIKPNSTTQIRPVFDASAHGRDEPSLNDCLEKGCNLIEQIPPLLHQFRTKKIGVVADIRRAFLQISINPSDRRYLKFLWKKPSGQLVTYQHNRVVFGLTSSPFLLGAVIQYHLEKIRNISKEGKSPYSSCTIDILSRCFYVDNVVVSVDSELGLQTFIKEATTIMAEGKFDLRAWEYTDSQSKIESCTPVLGLLWNRKEDVLKISTENLKISTETVTKRIILSVAHRVFDPLGIASPVTLCPKLLLKEVWQLKLEWDDEVPNSIREKFCKWVDELKYLDYIKVPRWLLGITNVIHFSIHIFCDASESAYATAIFLRTESETEVKVQLIQSKTRITPVKRITVPRLELLAANIGARLFSTIREYFTFDFDTYFWTDSSTVIAWLRRRDHWGTFVSNRVEEIRSLTKLEQWHHIPGAMNPADLPSRGCMGKDVLDSRWWEGPSWMYQDRNSWPSSECEYNEELILKEKRKSPVSTMVAVTNDMNDDWYYRYFSQYDKLIRMTAWILRFSHNCRTSRTDDYKKKNGPLSVEEIRDAEVAVLKIVQQTSFFGVEDPKLSSMQPFEDHTGLIRLRTKISNRPDSLDFRFPILLPKAHPVVTRLIYSIHAKECHVGVQGLMAIIRERFWIMGGRRTLKTVVRNCIICKRHSSKCMEMPTVPLPLDRVREASAFEVIGVDLAGPIYLKNRTKAWFCLFTCANVRAIHLELLQSLSTEDFLLALRRFIARRGRPVRVYSDQGTNFVGTTNLFEKIDWNKVLEYCNVNRISWRFNPPTAAWWGGWWERLIGLTKNLLRKVLRRSVCSYTEMETILCDCESVLNSRPLTFMADGEAEPTPITPSLFIQDIKEAGMPELDVIETTNHEKRWQHRMKLKQAFRSRFRNEYLGLLQTRAKNFKEDKINVGDIVLIGSDNSKRLDWPLAKVIKLFPGTDGATRLVRLKTSSGECMRPVQRLYRLLEGQISQHKDKEETNISQDQDKNTGVQSNKLTHNCDTNTKERGVNITSSGRLSKQPKRYSE